MNNQDSLTRQLVLFFTLTILLSSLLWLTSILYSNGIDLPEPLLILGQIAVLGPSIVAFVLTGVYVGKAGVKQLLRRAWDWSFKKKWLLAIIVLPLCMTAAAYGIKLIFERAPFVLGRPPAQIPVFAIIILLTGGPLEEFGWRGFALPRMLKKMPAVWASLLLGLLHALWHLPLHFIDGTVQSQIPFWEFSIVTIIGAVVYTWIYQNTGGSLTAAILFHWMGNLGAALFLYFDTMLGRWLFFGFQLIVVIIIMAAYARNKGFAKAALETAEE